MSQPNVQSIVAALAREKNVLLYGPPGTGKTWLVSELIAYLGTRQGAGGRPTLRFGDAGDQFGTAGGSSQDELPLELGIEWVTFHQSYSYEEFIIGRRPKPQAGGMVLEPHFGLLMTLAVQLTLPTGTDAYLLIIDELNRANTGQVFGEFVTLLDPSYRRTVRGQDNARALNVRFPGLSYENGTSEPIRMLRGGSTHQLPEDWTFPEHVYVLATMNSVDKAALPLDSALTRRFHRIEMKPSVHILASWLNVDMSSLNARAAAIHGSEDSLEDLSADETCVLLFDRLNTFIAADIGEDFELGHALFRSVADVPSASKWQELARVWDTTVLPQLLERYAGRTESLATLLKIEPGSKTGSAFNERRAIGAPSPTAGAYELTPLLSISASESQLVLQHLAI